MARIIHRTCPNCGSVYMQDWEEPDECPHCTPTEILSYEDWLEENRDELFIECSESGALDEADFDQEAFEQNKYEEYIDELGR